MRQVGPHRGSAPRMPYRTRTSRPDTLLRRANVLAPFVLAGHSFGGLYVLASAARYPEEVAGMLFIDCTDPATRPRPGGLDVGEGADRFDGADGIGEDPTVCVGLGVEDRAGHEPQVLGACPRDGVGGLCPSCGAVCRTYDQPGRRRPALRPASRPIAAQERERSGLEH